MQTLGNWLRLKERIQDYLNILFDYVPHKLVDFQGIDCGRILFSSGKPTNQPTPTKYNKTKTTKQNQKNQIYSMLFKLDDNNYFSQYSEKLNVPYI